MKIITWNVKGLGNQKKNTSIKATFNKYSPDIVMIQATKNEIVNNKLLRLAWVTLTGNGPLFLPLERPVGY